MSCEQSRYIGDKHVVCSCGPAGRTELVDHELLALQSLVGISEVLVFAKEI